ncbi:uncharacterized protein J4E87_001721 [Alternaria ethzedia]|uniref:uncharacterized protein n=1 Tax=Alternaria ethzedia TaxID=181014 RepID=UPI0020C24E77|nr:uncharacterized protein J4E87_001721 [Alternaria ethzedia]KAI4632249.1 hypothetical protein J4E87_001721 [Alternaria ethzedia]
MSATTRRSTRRTAATAATESSQPASRQSSQSASPAPEAAPKKKPGRKPKAAAAKVESQTVTESQQTVTKGRATSRANAASAVTTTTTTSSTTKTATQAPVVAKKLTRAGRQALKEAGVEASPQRSLEQTKPVKQGRGTARQKVTSEKRKAVAAKLAAAKAIESAEDEAEAENEDGMGAFFTKSKHQLPHSYTPSEEEIDNELRKEKYEHQEREIDHLRERVTNQEARIQNLVEMMWQKDQQMFLYENENLRLRMEITRLENIPHISYGTPANVSYAEFDSELVAISESSPAHGVFVNGNEEALALLHKIESSAKETRRVEPLSNDSETFSDNDVAMEPSPQQPSAKRTFEDVTATPNRPVATPSNIFSRSFSAIKSRLFSSTPKPPPTPEVASPTVAKPLPPQNTITETLSLPPTPVGERVKTPNKRRAPMNTLLKLLLKGVDRKDRHKAEEWAKQVIPELKNDTAFSEKRARLQKDVLCKELSNFPSAKPWETGFGDPLGDLDDDDVVPVWAVYLDIVAEEEEHTAKKHKKTHEFTTGDDEVPTIDEQFAASNGARTSPKLYNSHGQSASLRDFHPRRSIDPSPMFSNSISHNTGGNIFSELQGHDTAAQIRENDREVLKSATKENTHSHNPGMGSFSVPDDDSDEEDSTMGSESADAEATPIWTQPPPPAPVPAHAPLPGGSTDEASDVPEAPPTPTRQQPGDEIERQRQRLMKHTPAKPSRLREATYPSPSILSEAGNVSLLAATPAQMATSASSMFDDMPGAEIIELDDECQAEFEDIINSHEYQQKFNVEWQAPTLTYESDEEEPSPTSSS